MAEKSKVTRIKATDTEPKAKTPTKVKAVKATKLKRAKQPRVEKEPKNGFIGYFTGAWQELKLVRWPTRKATWALTVAVTLFSLGFVAVILLLDAGFNALFELIIGK